jgi:hypothetical protein
LKIVFIFNINILKLTLKNINLIIKKKNIGEQKQHGFRTENKRVEPVGKKKRQTASTARGKQSESSKRYLMMSAD